MFSSSRLPVASPSLAIAAALLAQGCALSTGPFAGIMTAGDTVNVGQKLDARLHIAEKSGVVIGIREAIGTRAGTDGCCTEWSALAAAGYAGVPTATTPRVGLDLVALGGGGRLPSAGGDVATGFLTGGQIGLPIRFYPPRRALWQADDYVGTSWQIVPDVTMLGFFPTSGADRDFVAEVSVGISLRLFVNSSILP